MANPIYRSQYTAEQIEASIGKTPIIDPTTKTWKVWDIETSAYVDTGIDASAQASALDSEAWAVGTRGGVPVSSSDETYENNAKWWAEGAADSAEAANDIALKSYVVFEKSGNSVYFEDGADEVPVKSAMAAIKADQISLNPIPTPDHPITITGYTQATISRYGRNLLNFADYTGDGVAVITDLPDQHGWTILSNGNTNHGLKITSAPKKKGTYALTFKWSGTSRFYVSYSGSYIDGSIFGDGYGGSAASGEHTIVFDLEKNAATITISFGSTSGTDAVTFEDVQLEFGDTATEFTPYVTSTEYVVSFASAGTLYGGTLDIATGLLTVTHELVPFKLLGNNNPPVPTYSGGFIRFTSNNLATKFRRPCAESVPIDGLCEIYTPVSRNDISNVDKSFAISGQGTTLFIHDDRYDSSTFSDFMTDNGDYTIALPLRDAAIYSVHLDKTQITTLLGENTFFADTGDIDLEYRADPGILYNRLADAIIALGGDVPEAMTQSVAPATLNLERLDMSPLSLNDNEGEDE